MAGQRDLFAAMTEPDRPALGILELTSIARGVLVADAAVKQAPSVLLMSRPVSSGKHLVMLRGSVAEVDESMKAARAAAADALLDSLELPYAHEQLWPLLDEAVHAQGWQNDPAAESVAVVETTTVCAAVGAADAAVKAAPVVLRDMRLAMNIGGKAFFSVTGALPDVQASAEAAADVAGQRLAGLEVIALPADEIRGRLIF